VPTPTPTPKGKSTPKPSGSPGAAKANATLPPGLTQPTFDIPQLARTAPKNTLQLVQELEPLTKFGFSLQQVLVQGFGRLPVAGVAFWHDDWLEPRAGPPPHLHHGLDMFADFGTPIRAPDDGEITGIGGVDSDPLGGNHVYLRGADGTEYYFAHIQSFAQGLYVGQHVKLGTVIAFVGNSGDAQNGPPHLHFEIHKPGPIPPKPSVDKWLADAEAYAPTWVKLETDALTSHKHGVSASLAPSPAANPADLDTTMLLTLLDPVGGSVGLLPRLELPQPATPVSNLLWTELIRQRLDGYLLVPGEQSSYQSD
jgi:murein DD-endopeptidase MepM/ murein hydrolase activator NlpD